MVIAIDGPAGSGKSSIARELARRFGLQKLDTGAMYRAVTYECLLESIELDDVERVSDVAQRIDISFAPAPADKNSELDQLVYIDGHDVTVEIRSAAVEHAVSQVASIPSVRRAMVALQQKQAQDHDLVAEGRDMGTVVFPHAELKVFLSARPETRALRRAAQREAQRGVSLTDDEKQEILDEIIRRDEIDSHREDSPLKAAADAHVIDSSDLSLDEVLDAIVALKPELFQTAEVGESQAQVEAESEARSEEEAGSDEASKESSKKAVKSQAKVNKAQVDVPKEKIRAFSGASFEDYYDAPLSAYPVTSKAFRTVAIALVWLLTRILTPWKFRDAEKLLDDNKKSRVIIMNHTSILDPLYIVIYLWSKHVPVRMVYKSEFNKTSFNKWFFSRVGAFPIERGTADMKAVRRSKRALERGEYLLIYPEGTRVRKTGQTAEVHGGFALIAHMAKADVQPVALVGAIDLKPEGQKLPHPGRVWLAADDKISFADLGTNKKKEQLKLMVERGMDSVYTLRDELRVEHPGRH